MNATWYITSLRFGDVSGLKPNTTLVKSRFMEDRVSAPKEDADEIPTKIVEVDKVDLY